MARALFKCSCPHAQPREDIKFFHGEFTLIEIVGAALTILAINQVMKSRIKAKNSLLKFTHYSSRHLCCSIILNVGLFF